MAAGCHRPSNDSYYGIAWVTVTSEPGGTSITSAPADFASYVVTVDSITLTRTDGVEVTALATPEIVDFTQEQSIAEMWGSATVPNGTYQSATITLDYTDAAISVFVNGVPTPAIVQNTAGAQNTVGTTSPNVTTFSETVTWDAANALVVSPTYASTSAQRLAINFDLAASGYVTITAGVPTVVVNPFLTVGVSPSDTKLIRIRGPLINTNVDIGTFTVYTRPFYDEVSNLGSLSLFGTANTVYTINGQAYTGNAGITQLSQLSAGSTITASYTTFSPSVDPLNNAPAGTFYPVYVVGGSTLEDIYTEGITGEVVARTGNTLTLLGSTLILNTADTFEFENGETQVLLGAGTLVTADGIGSVAGLNTDSIAVGQHITARGIYSVSASDQIQIDATGTSATNTGSVRLLQTQLWGTLSSLGAGTLTMNLSAIDDYPASDFDFAGNGTTTPTAAAFTVATQSLTVPSGTGAGDPIFINGLATPYGTAPPDYTAYAINNASSVQLAGGSTTTPGTQYCGVWSAVCQPATLRVLYHYSGGGSTTAFVGLSSAGFTIDTSNADSAVIRIGPETINLATLPASPQIVPTTLPVTTTFAPQYSIGNPGTSTVTPTITTSSTSIATYTNFADFVTQYNASVTAGNPVLQFTVRGFYNPTTNIFTASSMNVVL
jgi:hypothetical protein